jgi:hypothetical protein
MIAACDCDEDALETGLPNYGSTASWKPLSADEVDTVASNASIEGLSSLQGIFVAKGAETNNIAWDVLGEIAAMGQISVRPEKTLLYKTGIARWYVQTSWVSV